MCVCVCVCVCLCVRERESVHVCLCMCVCVVLVTFVGFRVHIPVFVSFFSLKIFVTALRSIVVRNLSNTFNGGSSNCSWILGRIP